MPADLPNKMRACQWSSNRGGIEHHMVLNANAPLPKNAQDLPRDSALVKVNYATINLLDSKLAELPIISGLLFSKPATPGLDYSGKVVATNIAGLQPGQAVFGQSEPPVFGTLGEYLIVNKQNAARVPDGVALEHAACLGCTGITAYQSIVPFVKPGAKVLINGASGGVGTFAIQIAKAAGCEVTAICSGSNVDMCKNLGADNVMDYRTNNVLDTLKRNGTQYDLIFDTVFKDKNLYWKAQHYLKRDGMFVTIAGEFNLEFATTLLQISLLPEFLGGGQRRFKFLTATGNVEQYEQLAKWMQEGKIKAIIEQTFELEDAGRGYARIKSGRTRGKLVVKVASE